MVGGKWKMRKFWFKCLLVVIIGISETNSGGDPFSQQPRIVVEDGHLVIRSALNRNVSLSSSGQGAVQINSVDMSKMVSLSQATGSLELGTVSSLNQRMTQLMRQWRSFNDLVNQVNQLEENVTDIVQRMNQFVGSDQNRITNRGVRRYFGRVKALEDKVNHLTELLTTNECSSNPCRNGGTCVDSYNGYSCTCPNNWEGPNCDNDVNECARYSGTTFGCMNGATCINHPGSFSCVCPANWYGIHCSSQHNDCSNATHQELCGHGTCVNQKRVQPGQPNYVCMCDPGWKVGTGSPACNQDIDECQELTPKCSMNPRVLCFNFPGSFHCGSCPSGYTGNGMWCADINECENGNGGCSQNPLVECYNTPGSRRCGPCPAGYIGNGQQCMYISVCSNNRGGCHPLATCIENLAITGTYRECRCPPGYTGSGEGPQGCTLSLSMSCTNNPCQHGTCQMVGQSFHCICQPGYFGTYCEIAEDPCFMAPCLNGGTCVRTDGTFSCNCLVGYSGPTCAEQRNECGGYLHGNNGTLEYPEQNHNYTHGENCAWVISVDPGKVVNITFDHFDLEYGSNCQHDFLQLNDGPNAGSWVVGRFCSGQLHGETFMTTHNQIYLWFHSDHSISAKGFKIVWTAVNPVCGGELNVSDYGSVQSPGYPGNYPVNRTCSWLVQVPYGKRIQFSFATLKLEHHPNCSFDFLKIFDGAIETDPVLGTYCSTVTPPPLITSGPTALLLFHSDNTEQDQGFHITYTATPAIQGCGGMVTEPQGSITSPNFFSSEYQDNLLCEWQIRIHPDNRLKITFDHFDLEHHTSCLFDYLEIYDGSSASAPLMGRFCSTDRPPKIISKSNQVFIRFRSDQSQGHQGFKLDFESICGGVYTDLTGILKSPNYNESYPNNCICLYEIQLPLGHLVNLTIDDIEIEHHTDCGYDRLEVRDGNTETSPLLALLCGETIPDSIVSTYNFLWIKFETDGSFNNRGFHAQYEAIDLGCGGVMVQDNGTISSPQHEDSYPHSTTCRWLIRAPEGNVIQLRFSTFVLESHFTCDFDYLLIEDINGVTIGKYCGTTKPPVITSLDNILLLKFVSDADQAAEGFIADYSFHDASETCGGTYYQESGIIRSPGYPSTENSDSKYPHSVHCIWLLQAPNNKQITLNITNFTLESHKDCKFDYLEIRNGGYEMSPVIGRYCGNYIPPIIRSHSNAIRLEFKTDSSVSGPGFQIFFDSTTIGCGGTLTTGRGSIVSPNFPQPYPHNADCLWLIRVSEGSTIFLQFSDLDIEEHERCLFDYIQIFDGNSENAKSLARLCNNQQIQGPIKSTGNTMLLRFRSDSTSASGGFQAVYSTFCNNVLTKRRGVIESPNFPNSYPQNHNCTWIIQAPPGGNISLSFSHLFIEVTNNCTSDYVEVLEDLPAEDKSLGRFCGDLSIPRRTLQTSTNTVMVRFITDRSVSREGFRLEWRMNGCGGDIIDKPYGNISSPNFPNGYPVDTTCYWHIWYPPGSRVEFTVQIMDIENEVNCEYDFVKLYAGEDENVPLLTTFCHSIEESSPKVITSHGNELFVHFHSDHSVNRGGFKAYYKKLEGGCGGHLVGKEANFMSPNHPYPYNKTDDCEWLIEVSSSNLVMLEFYEFEMPQDANCTFGHVSVYDGNNSSAPLLLKHCGAKPAGFITSTGNQMLVKLMGDGIHAAKGFRAHYKQGCGRRLAADAGGEIESPDYPNANVGNANCSWIIYASDLSEKVVLTITHLYISEYDNCTRSLQVYDGDREDSPRIGEYCGHKVPPPIVSRGSIMHVILKNRGIFRAIYGLLSEHCGGSFTAAAGSFASPGFPTNYDMQMECVWTIEASAGNKVHVTFQSFHIEENDYCNSDYLEIHENDPSGHLIGKFCGNSIPSNITWARKLWIKFRSDDIGTAPGFMAHYELQHGSLINGTSGSIASPGYPHKFQKEDVYEWTVVVPDGMFVSLQFQELAIMHNRGVCYAFVQIFDGMSNEAPDLGKFCGYQIPEPIVSSGNIVTIQLHSLDFFPTLFVLNWAAVYSMGVSIPLGSNCSKEYVWNGTSIANITSPNHPHHYPDISNCTYLIRAPNTHHILLKIHTLDIEPPMPQCPYDRLNYYYAPNTNIDSWVLNKTMCGRLRPIYQPINTDILQLTSPNNMMKLVFESDNMVNSTGFNATASAACGGQLFGDIGILHSSAFYLDVQNLNHSETLQCEWVITVGQRRAIRITFDSFNIQSDSTCSNYLMLRNGAFNTSPVLGQGRYCGRNIPSIPETSSNSIYIQLVYSSMHGAAPEFDLRYEEVSMDCGGYIFLSDEIRFTEISSPNYPNSPSSDIECEWVIVSPAGTRLRIDFNDDFNLAPNCWNDDNPEYLELYDGGTESAEVIGRFCGHEHPSSELTTSNTLFARYISSSQPQPGFKATITIAQCGGTISSFRSIIKSPNYPQQYGNAVECEWYLKMKNGYHITLRILDFEIQSSNNCSANDFLEIRDMSPEGVLGDVIRTLCGKPDNLPLVIDVPGSTAYMKFKSDYSITAKGFSISMEAMFNEGCGGVLEDPTGVITSPHYPNALPAMRSCHWRILAHEGRRVKFTFEELNLPRDETLGTCLSFVALANATKWMKRHTNDRHKYCGNNVPEEIDSESSAAYVYFHTTGLSNGQGFKLTYSTEEEAFCGGRLQGSSGSFQSPNFQVQNDSSIDCRWRIETDVNKTLVIKFSVLDLPGIRSNYCRAGVLYLTSSQNFIGSLCGNYTNGYTVTSAYPITSIRLIASLEKYFLGVRATYNTSDCGGLLEGYNAVITSPGYPNNYPPGTTCQWILKVPQGETIRLTVEDLRLEGDCTKDSLMIRNGPLIDSPLIGKFCGSHRPAPIVSSGNVLAVYFHSDEYGTAPGFNLSTTEVQRGCGGTIHMLQGNITSPNFPSKYDNNVECVWTIEYGPGYLVQVQFITRFEIEFTTECSSDYLQIEEFEDNVMFGVREKFCGSALPGSITSRTNKLRIKFHSDDRRNGDGFNLIYKGVCGGNFTDRSGFIISPNYNELYHNNLICNYTIGKAGDLITLTFDENFGLESHGTCIYDYIEIFQIEESDSYSQGKFCGHIPPEQRTLQGPVILKFVSDYYYADVGFKVKYDILNCGGELTEPTGIIASPPVSQEYNQEIDCIWHIQVESGGVIALRFTRFQTDVSYMCWRSYVAIYDGHNMSAPLIDKICGQDPLIVKSTGNQMTVRYRKGHGPTSDRNSFSAYYHKTYGAAEGCGGTLNATSGEISSVNVAGFYAPNLDCVWTIMANSPDQVMRLSFTKFDLQGPDNGSCSNDYVEIREGGNNGPLLGRFCGSVIPSPVISSIARIFIHFHSDGADNGRGFKIYFNVTESPCGTSALLSLVTEQTLSSPNYPNPYPANLRCTWRIYANSTIAYRRELVQISIKDIDVSCDGDYLQIKKYEAKRYCGSKHPEMIYLYSGSEINFYSDQNSNGAHGFSLTYRIASCSRNYTDESGIITNPSYPGTYNLESTCRIHITAVAGKTIALYFKRFILQSSYGCSQSFMKVYDGENENATSLGVYCNTLNINPIFSTGRSIFLDLKMRNFGSFHITYMTTDKGRGCGGKIFGTEGAISSPLYPQAYNQSAECIWHITVPRYHTIKLEFQAFALNSSAGCNSNYVEIFDGATTNTQSGSLKYCGQDNPGPPQMQSSQAVVKLVTDSNNDKSGFLLYFKSETYEGDPTAVITQRVLDPGETTAS